ncbi:alpha/beta fold hydrolase [Nonomuraea sediminis]|uniref:alpha/beta fold hydrolase n=1 Tax=Nonomuraea sediminis TaxID=2835864 RepID=UPI001BDCD066|nr:alpha/beta hydrolase [Nonomuraea sediminis]
MSSSVISTDGARIAFSVTGTGPALVIVDGAMGYRQFNPTEQVIAQALADRYTVYTYDRRGRGESGDAASYSVQAEIDDIAALIEHAGGQAALLGFSSGAVLVLEAALAGLPVTGLALYEPPFVVTDDRRPIGPDYRERLQQAVAEGRPGDAVAQFLTEAAYMPAEFVEPMRAEPYWAGMEQLAPTLAYDAAIMGRTMSGDPAELRRYAPVTTPTLVLYGGASTPWLAAGATTIAGILPNADLKSLPDQTHDVSPEVLVPALSDWLPTLKA